MVEESKIKEDLVTIKEWHVIVIKPYELVITGNAYGHPRFENGALVTTSKVIDYDKEGKIVTTKSRRYALGEINPDYGKKISDAEKIILKNIHKDHQ